MGSMVEGVLPGGSTLPAIHGEALRREALVHAIGSSTPGVRSYFGVTANDERLSVCVCEVIHSRLRIRVCGVTVARA
jgi:hypothetical protein